MTDFVIRIDVSKKRLQKRAVEKIAKELGQKINKSPEEVATEIQRILDETFKIQVENTVVSEIKSQLGQDVTVRVSYECRPYTRAERLQYIMNSIETAIEEARNEVESLRDEIENWASGMEGTGLESTSKYEDLQSCMEELENVLSELENIEVPDYSNVSFPGMF